MQSDLLPCPFCGKSMMLRRALWPSDGDTDAVIHAEATDCPMYDFCDGTADGSIVDKWNRRADLSDQQAVEVKALEWESREDGSYRGTSAVGYYHVFPGTGFSYDLCGPVGGRLATYKRLSDAKAAAQADYEQRIRSALTDESRAALRNEPVTDYYKSDIAHSATTELEPVAYGEDIGGKIISVNLEPTRHCTVPLYRRGEEARKFRLGDRVTKTKGSSWTGHVVGFYATNLTPIGYCVESENEPGSVQIYPENALAAAEAGRAALDKEARE